MTIRTIAVRLIRNARREIFMPAARRKSTWAVFWEFPGGKVKPGESPKQALYRELREETGIDVEQARLLATTQHHFAERQLAFYFFLVKQWRGTPCGNEVQKVCWYHQQALRLKSFHRTTRLSFAN